MNRAKKSLIAFSMLVMMFAIPFSQVSAQEQARTSGNSIICVIFPFIKNIESFGISTLCTGTSTATAGATIRSTFNLIVSLVFAAIIIFAIFIIIKSAITYIRSEGDETKIQQAQKAIKSVFIGIAALFVGLIGIIIIIAFFGAGNALSNSGDVNNNVNPLLNSILQGQ